jgi:hypothetical protein
MNDVYSKVDQDYEQALWTEKHTSVLPPNLIGACLYDTDFSPVEYYPPGHLNKVKFKPSTEKEFLDKLINDHWNYIEGVLKASDTLGCKAPSHFKEIEYHYKTAFAHGWKHHQEYLDANHA